VARRREKRSNMLIAQQGDIVGGRLHGWRYHFLRFVAQPDGEVLIAARCSAPHWPFPCDIKLKGGRDFEQLKSRRGERTPRLDAGRLIVSAFEIEGWKAAADVWRRIVEEKQPRQRRAARR
jgi:hypothetical protein